MLTKKQLGKPAAAALSVMLLLSVPPSRLGRPPFLSWAG